jgi:hypothetical protein
MTEADALRVEMERMQARIDELEAERASRTVDPPRPDSRASSTPPDLVNALQEEVLRLREEVDILRQAPTPPAVSRKEPKIGEPPEFSGKPAEYPTFIAHCELYFRVKNQTFENSENMMSYTISRLRECLAK